MEGEKKLKKPRAACYVRVSRDEPESYGMIYQEERLRAFVGSQDYILLDRHIYKDEGFSGVLPIEDRPGLKRLFEDAGKREFDVVLVYRLDRFGRRILVVLDAVQKLAEYDVAFRSITEPFDTTNAFGRYLLASLSALAELEREVIRERMDAGRTAAAREGKWVTGVPPYGYKYDHKSKKLRIDVRHAEVVKKFFHWLVFDKMSLKAITRRANSLRIPTKSKFFNRKRKTLGVWHDRVVGRILTNEAYAGIAVYRKYRRGNIFSNALMGTGLRPKEDWVEIPVPAIVPRRMVELARKQLLRNRELAARNTKHRYLFDKLIYCSKCGFKLFAAFHPPRGKDKKWGSKYYRGTHRKEGAVGSTKRCDRWCGQYAEARLEPIWDAVKEMLQKPEHAFEKIRSEMSRGVDKKSIGERLGEIDKEIESWRGKKRKLGYIFAEDETMTYSVYTSKVKECEKKIDNLSEERARLSQLSLSEDEAGQIANVLEQRFKRLKKGLNEASYDQKSKIIHEVVEKITLDKAKDVAEVELRLSWPDKGFIPSPFMQVGNREVFLQDNRGVNCPAITVPVFFRVNLLSDSENRRRRMLEHPIYHLADRWGLKKNGRKKPG